MSTGGDAAQIPLGKLTIDMSGLQARLNAAQSVFQAFAARLNGMGQHFAQVTARVNQSAQAAAAGVRTLGKAVGAIAAASGAGSVALIRLASDANEAASKFGFVFGKAADGTGKKLDEFAKAAGRSRYAMRDMAANIGALVGPIGFTKEKTGELSTQFAKLAVDLSSFFNVTEDDALMALKSGIVGESEPLRKFGVQLNEAKIQQEAFRLKLAKTKNDVQGSVKAQAILSIVMRETAQAQGDAIRTSDQFANSLRRMKDFATDAATDLGQILIPATTRLVNAITSLSEPIKEWAKANAGVLGQRLNEWLDVAATGGMRLVEAFNSAWQSSERFTGAIGAVGEKLASLSAKAKELWGRLPKWAQDAALVAGSMTAISVSVGSLGGKIPIFGEYIGALGGILSPLRAIKFIAAVLGPLLGVVFSPIGATVAIAAGALYGLYKVFQQVYERSAQFRESWEAIKNKVAEVVAAIQGRVAKWVAEHQQQFDRIADKAGEIFSKIKKWAGEAAEWLGDKLGEAMDTLTGGSIKDLEGAMDTVANVASRVMDAFEGLLDWFNGDGRRLSSVGMSIAKSWNNAMASILESIADVIDKASGMLYGPVGKLLSKIDPEFAELYMHYAGQNTSGVTNSIRGAAAGLRNRNIAIDAAQRTVDAQLKAEDEARDKQIAERKERKAANEKFLSAVAQSRGGQAAAEQELWKQIGAAEEAGRVQWDQANAAQKAQAGQQVANAEQGAEQGDKAGAGQEAGKSEEAGRRFVIGMGADVAAGNRQLLASTKQALRQQAAGMSGQQGLAARQAASAIGQIGQQLVEAFGNFGKLSGEQQTAVLALNKTYEDLVKQFKSGSLSVSEFQKQVKAAADQANKLAGAEKELTDEEIAALNAKGIFTPKQREAQQQAMQQAAEHIKGQLQGAAQQMAQQAGDMLKQGQDAYQQAIDQIDQQIGDALKSGNPQQFQAAIDALKGYAQAQIQQTLTNVANSGVDVNRTSFGSIERQGSGAPVAWNQLLTQNPQAAATIKLFQGILDNLNHMKIPHMAEGGVVTSPTYAMVGEAGPEAVIPLGRLQAMFGAPLNIFGNRRFASDPGGGIVNPLSLNAGNLGAFGRLFNRASQVLNQQLDLGDFGAQGILDRWNQVQQAAEAAAGWNYQHRRIDLGGNGPMLLGRGIAGAANLGSAVTSGTPSGTLEFHVHMNVSQALDAQHISKVVDMFDEEIRRRGSDTSGRRALNYQVNRRSPLTPSGQPR